MKTRVSVVLASYNGEKYIEKQLISIINQLEENDEIIVTDDNSTDKTRDIVSAMSKKDSRIKLIDGPCKGYNKNFENGINHSSGEYIFICDQDDEWMDNKVKNVLAAFDDNTYCIRHDCIVVNDNNEILCESYMNERKANLSYKKNIYKNTFTGCCMCIKREWLLKLLPFPDGVFYDAWIGILSCKFKKAKLLDDKLIKWCRHEGTVTKLKRNSILWIIKDRLRLKKAIRRKIKEL